jgi:hypothetical protein
MKHIRRVTCVRADALTDFLSAISRAWSDFLFAKKNEVAL